MKEEQHQKSTLNNGLTVLTCHKNDIYSVVIEVWIKAGSRYESKVEHGIAHFVEHMNFKGTKNRSGKDIAEQIDAIGGYLNAYTTKEYVVYTAKVLKEHLVFAIEILADMIFNSTYIAEEIDKERNVILQELGQSLDTPEEMVFEYFAEACFEQSNIGRTILGTSQNIKNFSANDIRNFVSKHYTAQNMQICSVGNLSHQEHLDIVQKFFKPFEHDKNFPFDKVGYLGGLKQKVNEKLEQCHLVIGYQGVTLDHSDYFAYEIIANIFGGSVSSRLFQEIREKRGLVYSVSAFNQYYSDNGVFCINLNTSKEDFMTVIEILGIEINKLCQKIEQIELDRCLAQVKSSLLMSYENTDNIVNIISGSYAWHNRYISLDEVLHGYQNVTLEKLLETAQEIFSSNKKIAVSSLTNFPQELVYENFQRSLTI